MERFSNRNEYQPMGEARAEDVFCTVTADIEEVFTRFYEVDGVEVEVTSNAHMTTREVGVAGIEVSVDEAQLYHDVTRNEPKYIEAQLRASEDITTLHYAAYQSGEIAEQYLLIRELKVAEDHYAQHETYELTRHTSGYIELLAHINNPVRITDDEEAVEVRSMTEYDLAQLQRYIASLQARADIAEDEDACVQIAHSVAVDAWQDRFNIRLSED